MSALRFVGKPSAKILKQSIANAEKSVSLANSHQPAGVAKLADAPDLGSGSVRSKGSSPFPGTFFLAP
jgi:hypothetical protein